MADDTNPDDGQSDDGADEAPTGGLGGLGEAFGNPTAGDGDLDPMSLVKDTLGPMIGGILGSNIKPILMGANTALGAVFRLIATAYEEDPDRTQQILTSDGRAMDKVAKLNDLVIDGSEGDE